MRSLFLLYSYSTGHSGVLPSLFISGVTLHKDLKTIVAINTANRSANKAIGPVSNMPRIKAGIALR